MRFPVFGPRIGNFFEAFNKNCERSRCGHFDLHVIKGKTEKNSSSPYTKKKSHLFRKFLQNTQNSKLVSGLVRPRQKLKLTKIVINCILKGFQPGFGFGIFIFLATDTHWTRTVRDNRAYQLLKRTRYYNLISSTR